MPKENIRELIERSTDIRKYFHKAGGNGILVLNVIDGDEFQEWLADIKATIVQLKSDSLTESIMDLTNSFDGWSDEKNFEKLIVGIKALYKNQDYYFNNKTVSQEDRMNNKNKVFVVHGRNDKIRGSMFVFLRSIGVEPIEWDEAKKLIQKPTPYIGEVLDTAFLNAQAIIVLFTPDDEAKLRNNFINDDDPDYERELTSQARPNVIFEAGMALGRMEDRTIIIEFGRLREFSDIGRRHIIKFIDTPEKRYELINHLKIAGVEVNIEGRTDWLSVGNFKL